MYSQDEIDYIVSLSEKEVNLFLLELESEINKFFDIQFRLQNLDEKKSKSYLALLFLLLGYTNNKKVAQVLSRVADLYALQVDLLKKKNEFTANDSEDVKDIATIEYNNLTQVIDKAVTESVSGLVLTAGLAGGFLLLNERIRTNLKTALTQTGTVIKRNLLGYQSAFHIKKAQDQAKEIKFNYVGPRDDKNRPFCRHVLDLKKSFSIAEIRDLDNDSRITLKPVFIFCGGWNCRHMWLPSEELTK